MSDNVKVNGTSFIGTDEEYNEVCACNMDLCNSFTSSSGVASILWSYPLFSPSKTTTNGFNPNGPSSAVSYSSSSDHTQFNFAFELVNTAVM